MEHFAQWLECMESKQIEIWLDDERDPNDEFIQREFERNIRPGMVWAKTAWDAISLLKQGNVSYISLDHDLGPPAAGTGLDVAKWIEEQAFHGKFPRLKWSLHSANPAGVRNMMFAMKAAERFWDEQEH